MYSLDFPYRQPCHLQTKMLFTSSSPILMHFVSHSCLIELSRTSSTICKRSGKNEHVILLLILRKSTQCFTIKYYVSCRLFVVTLYQVEGVPFFPSDLRFFFIIMKVFTLSRLRGRRQEGQLLSVTLRKYTMFCWTFFFFYFSKTVAIQYQPFLHYLFSFRGLYHERVHVIK